MRPEVSIRSASAILIASLAVSALAAVHPVAGAERGTITLRGTVLGGDGAPLGDTWVFSKGSRRVSALAGDDGRYTLDIPGGTVAELVRAPLMLRIQAQRSGWRIELADGAPELLLELRILVDSAGTARLRVRSSDPKIAAAVAGEAVLAGSPTTDLQVDFRGVRAPSEGTRSAALTAVQEVVLTGVELPPGQPTAARSGPIVIPTGQRAVARTSERPPKAQPPDDAPDAPPAVGKAPESERKPARVREPKAKRESEPRRDAAPKVYRPAEPARGTAPPPPRVYRPALGAPSDSGVRENGGSPRVYRPARGSAPSTPQDVRPLMPRVIYSTGTVFDSTGTMFDPTTTTVARDSAAAAPPEAAATSPPSAAPRDRVLRTAVPAPPLVAPSAAVETPPSSPPPRERVVEDPPAAAIPAGEPPEPGAEPADAWCTCRIEGFVEVRSEQRINGWLRVRVWLDGHPEIKGEAELFMGSPRSFVLRSVPCGPQKVRFQALSKQSFELVSPELKVDCTDGGVRQVRLVLEPSKRRGR